MKKVIISFVAVLAAFGYLATPASAAQVDFFLQIPGFTGGSSTNQGQFEVLSWSWGASNSGSHSGGGGGGAGKVSYSDLSVMISLEKASVDLLRAFSVHTPIAGDVVLSCVLSDTGAQPREIFSIKLGKAKFSKMQLNGATDPDPSLAVTQLLSFSYSKIEWTYTSADGSTNKAGYDLKTNKGF